MIWGNSELYTQMRLSEKRANLYQTLWGTRGLFIWQFDTECLLHAQHCSRPFQDIKEQGSPPLRSSHPSWSLDRSACGGAGWGRGRGIGNKVKGLGGRRRGQITVKTLMEPWARCALLESFEHRSDRIWEGSFRGLCWAEMRAAVNVLGGCYLSDPGGMVMAWARLAAVAMVTSGWILAIFWR